MKRLGIDAAPLALLPLLGLTLAAQPQKPANTFETTVRPFLSAHCLSCHQGAAASAGMTVEPFLTAASVGKDPDIWRHFLSKIRTGQMPPPGSPRPDPAAIRAVTTWITAELARQEKAVTPTAGRVTARRLNRTEYNNTIRDLLGVDTAPADDFPQDDSGYGFDNIGDVLSMSPPLLEKVLTSAERVARTAIFGPERLPPRLIEVRPARGEPPAPAKLPTDYDQTGLLLPQAVHTRYRFPADGNYAIHGVLTGLRPEGAEAITVGLWIDGKKVQTVRYRPQGIPTFPGGPQELYGQKILFPRTKISGGNHWVAIAIERLYEGLPASFGGPNPSKAPEPPARPFRFPPPSDDATPQEKAQFEERQKRFREQIERQRRELPENTRIGHLEIGGPYDQNPGPSPRSRALVFVCGHTDGRHAPTCAPKILASVTRRAFRRPVSSQELAPYLRLVQQARKQGDSFDEGLCVALQAVLVSPHFLFRIERDRPAPVGKSLPITDHELASRLSYFLWSTMPDAELARCADTGTLRTPAVLQAQVRRMLQDPKADALVENFGGQWLELRKLDAVRPDRAKFDAFDEYLRLSMRTETERFFQEIVRADRPVLDFIDGKYTFVNERLARFYGLPNVRGTAFRRVSLEGTPRGGILTQASVLTVTSFSTRTSPVLRGKWILDNILNAPPPPPPPGVPSLEETKVAADASLRQQLEEHRKKPLCASCHNRLDPLGFGLENFDAIGRFRTVDGVAPIEASGTLPGGKSFVGPQQLTAILRQDRDAFTRGLTQKLLTYALGRGLERTDRPTVDQIATRTARADYRFSSLVLGIVTSLPFQQREGRNPNASSPSKVALAPRAAARDGRGDRAAVSRRDDAGAGGAAARR
jgi:mono/diheme cytochrome c family protein